MAVKLKKEHFARGKNYLYFVHSNCFTNVLLRRKENTHDIHSIKNIIKKTFDTWQSRDCIEITNFEYNDEDEATITFNLKDALQNSKSVEIEKTLESGFILPKSIENKLQGQNHL